MADQHLECDGAAIAYEINGEGPLVGYAHGLFISRRMERWLRLVDWTPVRRGRRFLEYDARGHGLTGGRLVSDDYVWSNLARDLLAFVDTLSPGDPALGSALACRSKTRRSARHCAFSWLSCPPRIFDRETVNVFEIGGTRGARVSSRSSPFSAPQRAGPARPVHGLPVPVIALEEAAATLAAVRAPGYEPYDDEDGHRDQPDNDKRLERGEDPARGRDGKPDGEDRA